MRLKASLKIRNDTMVSARKKRHLSQRALAELAGVPAHSIMRLESLDFSSSQVIERAMKVAIVLRIPVDEIVPEDMVGMKIVTDRQEVKEIPTDLLIQTTKEQRLMLPCFEKVVDMQEEVAVALHATHIDNVEADRKNPHAKFSRDIDILKRYYGLDGKTPETMDEIAKKIHLHRAQIAMIIHRTEQKVGKTLSKLS